LRSNLLVCILGGLGTSRFGRRFHFQDHSCRQ
jgi:hypothetical protein